MQKKILVIMIFILAISSLCADERINSQNIVRTFIDENGNKIDEVIVPGCPPENYRAPIAQLPNPENRNSNVLSNMPAFNWSFGCSATSAAMMAGYYDNNNYSNMYTGPTNGGVMPMNNSFWPDVVINGENRHQCPLSATHNGLDGRTILGHVDDYWHSYGSDIDPYYGNWTQHVYNDCTADYMGTNQYINSESSDGATWFYFNGSGAPLYNYTGCEPGRIDGCHGFRDFLESRGYSMQVNGNYSQYIYGYSGNTQGFTYTQFKQEIDAGRPVLIQVEGHSMVGFGYDDSSSDLVYIHDTWDYNDHSMTWGGTYSGMLHYGVGIFHLTPIQSNPPTNVTISQTGIDILISWTASANANIYHIYRSNTPNSGFALIGSSSTTSYTDCGSANDSKFFYYVTADFQPAITSSPKNNRDNR